MTRLSETMGKKSEYPGPQQEWEKCKQLVDTIVQSGALQLLEKLYDSIAGNPTLGYRTEEGDKGIYLDMDLIVQDILGVKDLVRLGSQLVGVKPHPAYSFRLTAFNDRRLGSLYIGDEIPKASIALKYNEKRFYRPGEDYIFYRAPGYREIKFCNLNATCINPDELRLSATSFDGRGNSHTASPKIVQNTTTPEGIRLVDEALGELYSSIPAKPPDFNYDPIF